MHKRVTMPRADAYDLERGVESAAIRFYPDELTPAIQETLAILADLDFARRAALERLEEWDGPEDEKAAIASELTIRADAAREPYQRRLVELEQRARGLAAVSQPLVH